MKRQEVVLTKDEINQRVKELGKQITQDYKDKNLVVVSLLKGSFVFTADLVREIDLPVQIEFMMTSSYQDGFTSSGHVMVLLDFQEQMEEMDILIVDDIIDSGNTMKFVYELLSQRGPRSIKTCTLLDKPSRRTVDFDCDYTGFTIDDMFIVGYGLNYGSHYRNVDHIFAFVEGEN